MIIMKDFTESDWDAFTGWCESENPKIGKIQIATKSKFNPIRNAVLIQDDKIIQIFVEPAFDEITSPGYIYQKEFEDESTATKWLNDSEPKREAVDLSYEGFESIF